MSYGEFIFHCLFDSLKKKRGVVCMIITSLILTSLYLSQTAPEAERNEDLSKKGEMVGCHVALISTDGSLSKGQEQWV
jgi:hypothetical protein